VLFIFLLNKGFLHKLVTFFTFPHFKRIFRLFRNNIIIHNMKSNPLEAFHQLDTSTLVDKVEANLVQLLVDRKLKVGDSIPTEIELSKALGVSRTVTREALLRLRMMGWLETKKKKGSVITSPDIFGVMSKSMNPHILDQNTLKEIFELRLVLEIGMADLLFQRISPQDIEELKEIVRSEPDTAKDHLFNIDHEIIFHGKLYEITGNQTMKKFQKMLLPVFDYVHNSGLLKKQAVIHKFVSHKGLVDILENGSPELFRNAMRNHLENHFTRLFS
jgi:GntR family transcriptional repressor for pyruvate dehydrogenase complex